MDRTVRPEQPLESEGPTAERRARGAFADARTYEFERDETGSRRLIARTVRDLNAGAATRLRRLNLTPGQLMAAVLFERDHDLGRIEPRMTVDLARIGKGAPGGDGMRLSAMQARDRWQAALAVLRAAGSDTVRLVEAVVLNGASVTSASAAQDRYAHKAAAIAWAGTSLSIGLNLLETHYRATGRL